MKQFVPITDDLLYRLGGPPGPLVPYRIGVSCRRALQDGAGFPRGAVDQRTTVNVSPGVMPSLSAVPALSSSTYCAAPSEG